MNLGAPVIVTRDAGSGAFVGRRGFIVAMDPPLMVQLAGERAPLRFGPSELARADLNVRTNDMKNAMEG